MPGASRVERAKRKRVRLCVGLISGTSADAAEAALCRISGVAAAAKLELVAHVSLPFEPDLTSRILKADSAREICELDAILGQRFADAALAVIRRAGLSPERVDAIGSHGQTIAHLPPGMAGAASTLQIGEASIIAERTGVPVICDFRSRDMAAGGQGAPLIPYFDWAVFRKRGKARAFQNFGGIANVSVVGARLADTLAFDTGPGNMILDALARRASGGQLRCDLDGTLSRRGTVIPELLAELMQHPFLATAPPRSAGREIFGEAFAEQLWERHGRRPYDLIATALAFTVSATGDAFDRWVLPRFSPEAVYASGGGTRNPQLMHALQERLHPLLVRPLADLGFPEAAKEAACFALLASEHLSGVPANVPSATGARRPVLLGKLVP
ncbi:MAG TPA: anhydro-N-acetylmuramic acid kinase [Myxococcaceae bacterium]|nr:anhydro-N-acetylmuramic acid kinase [Myxococcaceae bacterium]